MTTSPQPRNPAPPDLPFCPTTSLATGGMIGALLLRHTHAMSTTPGGVFHDGVYFARSSLARWHQLLPMTSQRTLRRTLADLSSQDLLITKRWRRSMLYRINYATLRASISTKGFIPPSWLMEPTYAQLSMRPTMEALEVAAAAMAAPTYPGQPDRDGELYPVHSGLDRSPYPGQAGPDDEIYPVHSGPDSAFYPGQCGPDTPIYPGQCGPDSAFYPGQNGPDTPAYPGQNGPDRSHYPGHFGPDRMRYVISGALPDEYPGHIGRPSSATPSAIPRYPHAGPSLLPARSRAYTRVGRELGREDYSSSLTRSGTREAAALARLGEVGVHHLWVVQWEAQFRGGDWPAFVEQQIAAAMERGEDVRQEPPPRLHGRIGSAAGRELAAAWVARLVLEWPDSGLSAKHPSLKKMLRLVAEHELPAARLAELLRDMSAVAGGVDRPIGWLTARVERLVRGGGAQAKLVDPVGRQEPPGGRYGGVPSREIVKRGGASPMPGMDGREDGDQGGGADLMPPVEDHVDGAPDPRWSVVLEALQADVARPSYDTFVKGTVGYWVDGAFVVAAPSRFIAQHLQARMAGVIR